MGINSKTILYTTTGTKDPIYGSGFDKAGSPRTVAAKGGSVADTFTIEENIGGTWYTVASSSSGEIQPLARTGPGEGVRMVISVNTSGAINFSYVS